MTSNIIFDSDTQKNLDQWLNGDYDEQTKASIRKLIQENPKEITDAFYTKLSFGTGGLRGVMGIGSNRMNVYTVTEATQGLANYINSHRKKGCFGVFIGYDSRHNSKSFAEEAAKVLAANDIHVYLCPEIRPVPYVSFGCRYKNCQAAIMITASHNPAIYNGYKVYWSDGGQVVPPHDIGIINEVHRITEPAMVKKVESLENPKIEFVKSDVDQAYLDAMSSLQFYPNENKKDGHLLKITYTSLHGTGITLLPKAFEKWGFTNLNFVEKQIIPDGDFPTVSFPNPEEESALKLGIETMKANESDILIATDPDADRVGVVVKHQDQYLRLNGNQVACLCLEHILETNRYPERGACIKTIVTTELFQAISDAHHIPCFNVLTGFKYIAEMIHKWEQNPNGNHFIFGGEESYGYLLGTYTRDKDAIVSSALICETALHAKRKGKTLIDLLNDLFQKYGIYEERLLSLKFPDTKEGREKIERGIEKLQNSSPAHFLDTPVVVIEDYAKSIKTNLKSGKTEMITLPKSEVLIFWLEDQTKLIIRPSGTEPKIKIYCGVTQKTSSEECGKKAEAYIKSVSDLIT